MESFGTDPLLVGLATGDERAFAELYDRYGERLYRAAAGMLASSQDAEDVVQEVFVALVRSRRRLMEVQDLTAYLFASLRRAAGRCAARRQREPSALETATAEALARPWNPDCGGSEENLRLRQALQTLPPEQREVVVLRIDGELTFAEIGGVLGVSVNTAASRYRYALEKLRTVIGKER